MAVVGSMVANITANSGYLFMKNNPSVRGGILLFYFQFDLPGFFAGDFVIGAQFLTYLCQQIVC